MIAASMAAAAASCCCHSYGYYWGGVSHNLGNPNIDLEDPPPCNGGIIRI